MIYRLGSLSQTVLQTRRLSFLLVRRKVPKTEGNSGLNTPGSGHGLSYGLTPLQRGYANSNGPGDLGSSPPVPSSKSNGSVNADSKKGRAKEWKKELKDATDSKIRQVSKEELKMLELAKTRKG